MKLDGGANNSFYASSSRQLRWSTAFASTLTDIPSRCSQAPSIGPMSGNTEVPWTVPLPTLHGVVFDVLRSKRKTPVVSADAGTP